jgi:hypothetical protein
MKNERKRKPVFDVIRTFFKSKPDDPVLRERYNALRNEHETVLAENSALRRRLAEYESEHGADQPVEHEGAMIAEHETASPGETQLKNDAAQASQTVDDAADDMREEARFGEQLSLDTVTMDGGHTSDEAHEAHSDNPQPVEAAPLIRIDRDSPNDEKAALFLSLFIGRDDFFAKHFYSKKTDSSAYSPVCDNEWDELLCNKHTKEFLVPCNT